MIRISSFQFFSYTLQHAHQSLLAGRISRPLYMGVLPSTPDIDDKPFFIFHRGQKGSVRERGAKGYLNNL